MSVTKPRPANNRGRKRRAAGWTLLVLGVFIAGVWVASRWYWIAWGNGSGTHIGVRNGYALYMRDLPPYQGWRAGLLDEADRSWVIWQGWETHTYTIGGSGLGDKTLKERRVGLLFHSTFNAGFKETRTELVIWPNPLLLWTSAGFILYSGSRARRRAQNKACPTCGYSLAGLGVDAKCPECGKAGAATT